MTEGMTWSLHNNIPTFTVNNVPLPTTGPERVIKEAFRALWLADLKTNKKDQGRTAHIIADCPDANHFMAKGEFTRFAEWRFIHKARLNLLPLNATAKWKNGGTNCRKCGFRETLAHVINHCLVHMPVITERHNKIQDRIASALPRGMKVDINMAVKDFCTPLRPDLVIYDEDNKKIRILDVGVSFESSVESLERTRLDKCAKYEPIVQFFQNKGYHAEAEGIVFGSLGGVHASVWPTLLSLGIKPFYAKRMLKLIVSDNIKYARAIYTTHITGVKQKVPAFKTRIEREKTHDHTDYNT